MTEPDRKFIFLLKNHKQVVVYAKSELEAISTFFEFFPNEKYEKCLKTSNSIYYFRIDIYNYVIF